MVLIASLGHSALFIFFADFTPKFCSANFLNKNRTHEISKKQQQLTEQSIVKIKLYTEIFWPGYLQCIVFVMYYSM